MHRRLEVFCWESPVGYGYAAGFEGHSREWSVSSGTVCPHWCLFEEITNTLPKISFCKMEIIVVECCKDEKLYPAGGQR